MTTSSLWSIAGLFIISISYTVIRQFESRVFVTQSFSGQTVYKLLSILFIDSELHPLYGGYMFFLAAIYAFYRIVTSMGDEERAVDGRKSIYGSVFWTSVINMMLAGPIVRIVDWKCGGQVFLSLYWLYWASFSMSLVHGIIAKLSRF